MVLKGVAMNSKGEGRTQEVEKKEQRERKHRETKDKKERLKENQRGKIKQQEERHATIDHIFSPLDRPTL